jgi:hypothetical protein
MRRIAPTWGGEGRFSLRGVPEGPYFLQYDSASFLVSSSRQIDLGRVAMGRPDALDLTGPLEINLDVTQLNPWQADDYLEFYCANTGTSLPFSWLSGPSDFISEGTTMIASPFDYLMSGPQRAINGSRGDRMLLVQHVTNQTPSGTSYQTVGRLLRLAPFSLTDGVSIVGPMAAVPQSSSVRLSWQASAFLDVLRAANPGTYSSARAGVALVALPGAATHGDYDAGMELVGIGSDVDEEIHYGDPHGVDTFMSSAAWVRLSYPAPSGGATITFDVQVSASVGVGVDQSRTLIPVVGPVGQIRLNGEDFDTARTGATTTPTLSWSPPSIGQATAYDVLIHHLPARQARRELVATFTTARTELRVLPDLLKAGETYVFQVRSRAGLDFTASPFRTALPSGSADALTPAATP